MLPRARRRVPLVKERIVNQRIGLNMYTLRDSCGTAAELRDTLGKLRDIGYRYVQISGLGGVTPDDIVAAMSETGLRACATHLGWDRFLDDADGVIALHRRYGTNHSAVGSLPGAYRGAGGVARLVEEAGRVLPRLTDAGIDFSYHNHYHEFVRIGGTTWLDMLHDAGAAAGIKFEIDTYWVAAGGADPAEYIHRFHDAISIVHVKDMNVTEEREQRFAPVGRGNLNWPRIFDAIRAAPVEFVIVEQDAHYDDDPLDNVAESYRFLRENGFAQE